MNPSQCGQRIEVELRVANQQVARQIMDRTIQLLQTTAEKSSCSKERQEALDCIERIQKDNRKFEKNCEI